MFENCKEGTYSYCGNRFANTYPYVPVVRQSSEEYNESHTVSLGGVMTLLTDGKFRCDAVSPWLPVFYAVLYI